MKKAQRKGSLLRQWMLSVIGPLAFILLVVCLAGYFGISSFYVNGMKQKLSGKVSAATSYFETLTLTSYSDYYQMAVHYTENFEEKNCLELQLLSGQGRVITSSYGLTAGSYPETEEITQSIKEGSVQVFVGQNPSSGEEIMAVSQPIYYNGFLVGVLRMVTSMTELSRQVYHNSLIIALISLAFLLLFSTVNLLLFRRILNPIRELTSATARIAEGSYGVQINYPEEDELGQLVDSVNQMSTKIGQNERMQREFISSVSHELRTPLTAIHGWSETIAADPVSDEEQTKKGMSIILKETKRLSKMVEELLDFSRIQDGRFSLTMEPIDLEAEFEDALFTYRELYQQEGITLNYEPSGEMYPPIQGDSERLKQVFCNILDNAAKHGGQGKTVDASVSHENNAVIIRIRDHGPGIPEEELPFVKEKFYKGSSKARGSGIGLAVCDEIIKHHNGEFTIANAEGGGTLVTLSFPTEQSRKDIL